MTADDRGVSGQDTSALRALVGALRAAIDLDSPHALARAVLREVHGLVRFEFGVVLQLTEAQATVVGVYPAPLAGIAPGVAWPSLDVTERELLRLGEPRIDGVLRVAGSDRSPLTRLPASGMRSAMRAAIFDGAEVAGAVLLYSDREAAFSALDGLRVEECTTVLSGRLGGRALVEPRVVRDASESAPAAGAPVTAGASPADAGVPSPAAEPIDMTSGVPAAAEPAEATPVPSAAETERDEGRRLSALGELVAGVAHELNNPLTTILGYAQLLPSLAGDELRQATVTIEQEAQRAGRIVRNLLYFARQHRPRVESVDLNALLSRVIEVRRYNLESSGIVVDCAFGDLPEVHGDQYQLEQVFLNLLTNAQQALEPGAGMIHIASERIGEQVRVSVMDTGPGIPEELASRVFEPFFTTREVGEGTGLGLSIAYGIVQAHGGRLYAERAPGGGARLVVELPLGEPAAATPAPAARGTDSRSSSSQGRGERVLVVEDEAEVRVLIATILRAGGYAVVPAVSGEEALRELESGTFAAVVSDVRMPGVDGRALLDAMAERWPEMVQRLIFVSGDIEADRFGSRLRASDVRYLEKPFSTADLLGIVRAAIDGATP